ncbi:MAG: HNH endonuclease [archaeon]|nr:HNH endonuclease [archaeon]
MNKQICRLCKKELILNENNFRKIKRHKKMIFTKTCIPCLISEKEREDSCKEKRLKKNRTYYWKNHDKQIERRRKYGRENKDIINAQTGKRRAKIKNAITDDADLELIKEFYTDARNLTEQTGIPHEVDHIIPLSKDGLHHQDNLQVLTAKENRQKHNKIIDNDIV